jgi:hypothetical protein
MPPPERGRPRPQQRIQCSCFRFSSTLWLARCCARDGRAPGDRVALLLCLPAQRAPDVWPNLRHTTVPWSWLISSSKFGFVLPSQKTSPGMKGLYLKDFSIFALGSFRNFHVYHPAHALSNKGEIVFGKYLKKKYRSHLPVRLAPERAFWLAVPAWTFGCPSLTAFVISQCSFHRDYSDTFPKTVMCPGNIIVQFGSGTICGVRLCEQSHVPMGGGQITKNGVDDGRI